MNKAVFNSKILKRIPVDCVFLILDTNLLR